MPCACWRASCVLTVNLSIFMVANVTQRRAVARRVPVISAIGSDPRPEKGPTRGLEGPRQGPGGTEGRRSRPPDQIVGQGSGHGALGARTGTHRSGVLRPPHDGDVGARSLQERARDAGVRPGRAGALVGRGGPRPPRGGGGGTPARSAP